MIGFAQIHIQFVDCPKLLAEVVVIELTERGVNLVSVGTDALLTAVAGDGFKGLAQTLQYLIERKMPHFVLV